MGLPVKLLVEHHNYNMCQRAGVDCECREGERVEVVVLCPFLGEVNKCILLWGKPCPMPPGLLQALLVEYQQCSAVLFCCFAKGYDVHIINKASARSWDGKGVANINEVSIVDREYDWE